jgi:hypothetical protein
MHHSLKPLYASALVVIAVNGCALLYCKYVNHRNAERYYRHFEPIKFYMLQLCYTLVILALSYNVRFLVSNILKNVKKVIFSKFFH